MNESKRKVLSSKGVFGLEERKCFPHFSPFSLNKGINKENLGGKVFSIASKIFSYENGRKTTFFQPSISIPVFPRRVFHWTKQRKISFYLHFPCKIVFKKKSLQNFFPTRSNNPPPQKIRKREHFYEISSFESCLLFSSIVLKIWTSKQMAQNYFH